MYDDVQHIIRDLFNGESWNSDEPPAALLALRAAVASVFELSPEGLPPIKLIFGPEHRGKRFGKVYPLFTVWSKRLQRKEQYVAREFLTKRGELKQLWVVEEELVTIPMFRWKLMQLIPTTPASRAAWESQRYDVVHAWDANRLPVLETVDALGEYPEGGWYREVQSGTIARHAPAVCCDRAERRRRPCYGYYHEPGEDVLEAVRKMWRRYNAKRTDRRPDELPTEREIAASVRETENGIAAAAAADGRAARERLASDLAPFEWALRGDVRVFFDPTKRYEDAATTPAARPGGAPKAGRRTAKMI